MASLNDHKILKEQVVTIVRALHGLRDALVELSLALHDYQFYAESNRCKGTAAQLSDQCINKARNSRGQV